MGIATIGAVALLGGGTFFGGPFRSRRIAACMALLGILGAGFACGRRAARPPAAAVLADHPRGATGPWLVRGRLLGDPQPLSAAWRVDLGLGAIRVDGVWHDWPLRVRTTVYDLRREVAWHKGDGFEAFLALRSPRPARNPLVAAGAPLMASGADVRSSLKSFRQMRRRRPAGAISRITSAGRSAVRRAIARRFAEDAPLVDALLLGERGEVPAATTQALARTGLVHLIAISGLHVGVIVTALFALLRLSGLARPHAALACACALPLLYAMVVPRPSVARACLMAAAVLLGIATGRRTSAINGLAVATLALTATDPWVARSIGFQLSTAATGAILLCARRARRGRPARRLLGTALVYSCAAQLGVAHILATSSYRLPLAAVPLNLAAVPLMATAVVTAMATLLLDTVGATAIGDLTGTAAITALGGLRSLAFYADRHVAALAMPARAGVWVLPASMSLLVLLASPTSCARLAGKRRTTRLRLASGLAAMVFSALLLAARRPPPGPPAGAFRLVSFDIGQGDALLVETHSSTVLVDTGGSPVSSFDTGTVLLAPALRARGVTRLDAVAITHLHADHAGGLRGLLAEIPAGAVWTSSFSLRSAAAVRLQAAVRATRTLSLAAGHRRTTGDCAWRTLHPPPGAPIDGSEISNDGSLVLAIRCGRRALLLTGDTEAAAEARYAAASTLPSGGVLKSPHHGSATSSTPALLDALTPRHVVISVGWRNRFGLPKDSVLERYRSRQMAVYRTDRDGAVTVAAGVRIRVRGERWAAGRGRNIVGGWLY
jgi:competence protein ComEC